MTVFNRNRASCIKKLSRIQVKIHLKKFASFRFLQTIDHGGMEKLMLGNIIFKLKCRFVWKSSDDINIILMK